MVSAGLGYIILINAGNEQSSSVLVGVGLIALFFALYQASIWTSLTIAMPKSALSLGYGICSSSQMVFGTIFPKIVGKIIGVRDENSFGDVLFVTMCYCGFCFAVSIVMNIIDFRNGGMLNMKDSCKELKPLRDNIEG